MGEILCNIIISIIVIPSFIFTLRFLFMDKKEKEFRKNMKKHWNKKAISKNITDEF